METMPTFIQSLEELARSLKERVIEARRRKVLALATAVQEATSEESAQAHWKDLERTLFGQ
jgi:hypothetical protein